MNIWAKILMVIHILVCVILIALVMMQTSEEQGASSAITGGNTSFFDRNQGRTKEGMLKKLTLIFGVVFAITTIAFGILYSM